MARSTICDCLLTWTLLARNGNAEMFDRAKLLADLEEEEKLVRLLYDDKTGKPLLPGDHISGNPTIGIGWNVAAFKLTDDQYRTICGWILDAITPDLYQALPWLTNAPEPVQRALSDLQFNIGLDDLLTFDTFLTLLQFGKFEEAASDLQTTKWWTQVGTRGPRIAALIRQAEAVA